MSHLEAFYTKSGDVATAGMTLQNRFSEKSALQNTLAVAIISPFKGRFGV
jgi:hypothetical protein